MPRPIFSEHKIHSDRDRSWGSADSADPRPVPLRPHQPSTSSDHSSGLEWPNDAGGLALGILEASAGETCLLDTTGTVVATNATWREFGRANGGDVSRTGVGANYLDVLASAVGLDAALAAQWGQQLTCVLSGALASFEFDYECDAPDKQRWYTARIHSVPGFGACVSHVDVSDAMWARLALGHALHHDPITRLPNRGSLQATIAEVVTTARVTATAIAVAVIDIEGVARVNDSLGHAIGDDLLSDVAIRLGENLTGEGILGRLAADTFVVVWREVGGAGEATAHAQRLLDGLRGSFAVAGGFVDIAASIGIAFDPWPQDDSDELVVRAESAMRQARADGGGCVHLYTPGLRAAAAARWQLECEIRMGLERGEFLLHYQPVVDLRSGSVVGVEALIRWQHPDGLRMPDTFIAVAESSGLIVPLGEWVLHEACRQGARWVAEGLDLRVAVNFSAQQIGHADVVARIADALRTTGMKGERLLVEVTESTVLEHAERTQHVLDQLRALGIEVAIDDFGTGYSSLLYLKRYPIQALKVDRQFVSGMGTTMEDDAIVAGVIAFARAVGATCIAEGVETDAQYELLQDLRCRFAQGYLFSPPVAVNDVSAAIEACRMALTRLREPSRDALVSASVGSGVPS